MSDEEETVFTISIPLHLLPLQVSIPLQIFSVGPVPNLASLQRRVESLSVFPACWVTIPCERVLMFMKVSCMEQEVQVDFNLQVTEDFTWTGPPLCIGFSNQVDQQLMEAANIAESDGASSNRRFFKLHDPTAKFLHKTLNTHDPDRYNLLFSDPPHLIKTTRNCWSRCKLVVELLGGIYLADNDPSKTSPGLRLVPKLKSTFLSERLCQDPLEQFFGCQRQRGRTNDNPTVKEFCKNTQALRVVNSLCAGIVKGNCRGKRHANRSISEMDLRPLAKRPRTKSCT
eukprot:Em0004g1119a